MNQKKGLKKNKISVIIPALNEEKFIEKAIRSLQSQIYPKEFFEIIVVDNGSSDRTSNIAKKCCVHKLLHVSERGTNYARDAGWRQAKNEIIAFLDADCVAPPDWLEKINNHFQAKPDLGLLCGRYDFPEMSLLQRQMAKIITSHVSPKIVKVVELITKKPGVYITGGNFAVTKNVLKTINGLDKNLTFWGDDIDTGLRIVRAGIPWKYDPAHFVYSSIRRFRSEGNAAQIIKQVQVYFEWFNKT